MCPYQMPGKRDCITIKDNGVGTTLQKRILLYNVRETYGLFLDEYVNTNITLSLTSFNELRPSNILTQSNMSHRSCLCTYHENINLLLKSLFKYIRCTPLESLQQFSSMLVCDETEEKCMFSSCLTCKNYFKERILDLVKHPAQQIKWSQWAQSAGKTQKIDYEGTIEECLAILKEKTESFLTHVFIKRRQSDFFEAMKTGSSDETICLQVDYSENFRLVMQDAVQSSYYSQNAVSLFTSYVWCTGGVGGQSYVYVSNNLDHDKYCISASLDKLFKKLKQRFNNLKEVHVFSDGATQQFKQKFLFRNLCRLSEEYKVNLHISVLLFLKT